MSYAISILFFGWSGKDAVATLKTLINKKPSFDEVSNEVSIAKINQSLTDNSIPLTCGIFKSCMEDDEYEFYLHFEKIKYNSSDNDEDISVATFSIIELKSLMKQSFELKQNYPSIKKPRIISLIVSESK